MTHKAFAAVCGACLLFGSLPARGDAPRVLEAGKLPNDSRLGSLRTLNTYAPFTPSKSVDDWRRHRAERVRRQILVATGLWPMPTKTPNHAVVHGKVDRDDYTVEKVSLETYPGFYLTGSLYRPKGKTGRLPAVLCPYGHWANGRFHQASEEDVKGEIASGAEKYEIGGRYPVQAYCVGLARMGCVAFQYDMVGRADCVQIGPGVAHGFDRKERAALDTRENWGLFSTQAELRQQSVMGLLTYNSLCALDWLCTLSDVDPARIGVTGASGGGTQTFILGAIDSRPAVTFPAVMVSTEMQGGCECENASNLRINTTNVEFAAMFAPKPLGMTCANDWTHAFQTKGLPELQQHYALLGAPDKVAAKSFNQFGHNYNYVSRAVMYEWFNQHLNLGQPTPIVERDFQPLTQAEASVWDADHPRPTGGVDFERSLCKWMTEDSDRQIAALTPVDAASLAKYRQVIGGAVDVLIGRTMLEASKVEFTEVSRDDLGDYFEIKLIARNEDRKEELPVLFLRPKANWSARVAIWVTGSGKSALYDEDGDLNPQVEKLLEEGVGVVLPDLIYQGEFLAEGKPLTETRVVKGATGNAAYTFGYNSSVFAQRVHDILTMVALARNNAKSPARQLWLIATDGAGPWAAAAMAQAGPAIDRAAIDTGGFRFTSVASTRDINFLPGGAKYGDLPGVLALAAPTSLWLAGEGTTAPPVVLAAYSAAGKRDSLIVTDAPPKNRAMNAVDWLLSSGQ